MYTKNEAHLFSQKSTQKQAQQTENGHVIPNCESETLKLTGSLVFDEEELEALLESVLVHVELHLHPGRRMERWAVNKRGDGDNEGAGEKRGVKMESLQVTEDRKHFFYRVKSRTEKRTKE